MKKTIHTPKTSVYKLHVRKSKAGLGAFAGEDIPRDKFIVEYFGPVLTRKESDIKGGKYLFETSENRVIDGSPRYNTARYINHGCKPNCETDVLRGKVYIYSTRKIKNGEELSFDYGKEYFNDFIKPHGCRCLNCFKVVKR